MQKEEDIMALKKSCRKKGRQIRESLSEQERKDKSKAIERRLFQWGPFSMAENVCCFISFKDEVDTHYLIDLMRVMGKRVYVPIVDRETGDMLLSLFHGWDELEISSYGILEPKKESWRIKEVSDVDFMLVPGLLFSYDGKRIGYGGGYYDRLMPQLNTAVPKVGICFEEQMVDDLPTDKNDILLDAIVTDVFTYELRDF